ncbi:MAG: hypothetical protein HOP11_12985 [Saprospiraceae bacterium]|nr:hypothetical protein [Saprospiraceae bacterium]
MLDFEEILARNRKATEKSGFKGFVPLKLVIFVKSIFPLFLLVCLGFTCSPNLINGLDSQTKDSVSRTQTYVNWVNENTIDQKRFERGPKENFTVYYNHVKEIIRLDRLIKDGAIQKEFKFYLLNNFLVYSENLTSNTAKVKNHCLLDAKQHYFSQEKAIFAAQKTESYKNCDQKAILKFEKKPYKNLEISQYIYKDEMAIIEKLKNFIK